MARANYRQTLVTFNDGVLTRTWTQNHQHLRLCGTSITGIASAPYFGAYDLKRARNSAISGAYSMADELGLERPKNITCGKPSGTLSKVMDTTEGIHCPPGRYVFNHITFNATDPLVPLCRQAGYLVIQHPVDPHSVLIRFPQEWPDVPFERVIKDDRTYYINTESAVDQLERYRFYMRHWCEQNMSCTISYDPDEVEEIVQWLDRHWDDYVGVSWMFRMDPTKTPEELGVSYLPQQVVDEDTFRVYCKDLKPVDYMSDTGEELIDDDCTSGNCPVR